MNLRSNNTKSAISPSQSKTATGRISVQLQKSTKTIESSNKNKPIGTKQSKSNEQEINEISKMVTLAMNKVRSLRNAFMNFQETVDKSINSMNTTINAKGKHYMGITGSLQNEIDSIKKSLQISNEMMKSSHTVSMDTRFAHILHGHALMQMEYEYMAQHERLQNKVYGIEKSNEQAAETINDLVTSISTFMNIDSNGCHHNTETIEKIGDIENAIESMEHEIK